MADIVKKGTFYGVGVGPGDPELLTLKAVRVLERCPVIAAPRTRSGEMLALDIARGAVDLEGKTVVPLYFTMERDRALQHRAHEQAARQVAAYLDQGMDVAMLNLGDVSIYATYSYLMELLAQDGYPTRMIPGVPSFCAVAARLGISLTEMDRALHIAPGGVELAETLDLPGTRVLMKSGRQLPQVLEELEKRELLSGAMLVANCGLPEEQVWPDLGRERPEGAAGYFATLVVKE